MTKKALRDQFKTWRKGLSRDEVDQRSEKIAQQFIKNISLDEVKYIHVFLPIAKWSEPNTFPLIHQIWYEYSEIETVISVSNFNDLSMKNYILKPETELSISEYGIPEPVDADEVENENIDLVIIPFLAVDQQGYRVGYGKGFYDRFLSQCKPTIQKIGIGFEEQLIEQIEDVNEHDQKLDVFISEKQLLRF